MLVAVGSVPSLDFYNLFKHFLLKPLVGLRHCQDSLPLLNLILLKLLESVIPFIFQSFQNVLLLWDLIPYFLEVYRFVRVNLESRLQVGVIWFANKSRSLMGFIYLLLSLQAYKVSLWSHSLCPYCLWCLWTSILLHCEFSLRRNYWIEFHIYVLVD